MNLSVIHYDKASKRHIMRLNRMRFAGREFAVDMAVCEKPLCPCCNIDFVCTPLSDGTPSPDDSRVYRFALDASEWKIASRPKPDRESRYLAKQLVAELEDADWHALYSHLVQVKREQLRAADLDELEVEFLADVLADPTQMVAYSAIFSFEPNFQFLVKDREWLIDCQFCVNPECDCNDTYISFIPLPDSPAPDHRINERLPGVIYDYKTNRYRIDEPPEENQPTADELIVELKKTYPDINATLKKWHNLLRRLYKKATRQTRRQPAGITGKIGRNDPCPCGSGKKYKKCCGR